jgi:ATP-dependent DNA ligase
MLPSLAAEPPASDHWLHEIKHDGYCTLLLVDGGNVSLGTGMIGRPGIPAS